METANASIESPRPRRKLVRKDIK
jgi:hypothetical protein